MGRSKRKRNGDRTTKALANMALQLKEQAFKRRFGELDDDKLLNYLAYCTEELGIGPACTDVLGAAVLKERFGDWDRLLLKIGRKPTPYCEREDVPGLFAREVAAQAEIHKKIVAAMQQNEKNFAFQHAGDSDEELLEYVRGWAKRLKRTPRYDEVLGGEYIRKRFKNDWQRVLHLAGLKSFPDAAPRLHRRPIYLDEAKKQVGVYVEECMQEIAGIMQGKKVRYVAPTDVKSAV